MKKISFSLIMIKVGKEGSICLYWNDLLISSIPIGKRKWDDYLKESEKFILDSMKQYNKNIKEVIYYTKKFCDITYRRKLEKKRLNTDDHSYFQLSLISLVRLKLLDFDDVCLRTGRKKIKNRFCDKLNHH